MLHQGFFVLLIAALASGQNAQDQFSGRQMRSCIDEGDFHCVGIKMLNNLYKLIQKRSIGVMDNVKLEYSGDDEARDLTVKALKDHDWISLLSDAFPRFISNLSWVVEEGRGHKERFIFPLLAAGGFYTLLITLGVIAAKFLGFNALLVGKISLVISAITGLAKIFNQKNNAAPVYSRYDSIGSIEKSYVDRMVYNSISDTNKPRSWETNPDAAN